MKLLITPLGAIFTKNSLKSHCFSLKSVVPQAQRCDIEEALIPLFEETNADSVKFVNYEREIHKKLTRKLSLRKNVLRRKWLKKLVREAFDRHRKGNAHVMNEIFEKFALNCAFH